MTRQQIIDLIKDENKIQKELTDHYFQRYSKQENNATLEMFGKFAHINRYLDKLLKQIENKTFGIDL